MERFLIALDCMPDCLKIIDYMNRVLNGTEHCEFTLFHILPTASPDKMRMEDVQRIERIHTTRPELDGYFWRYEDEKKMERYFSGAREKLVLNGFSDDLISSGFGVESGDLANIILLKAADLGCSTIVLGRKRLGRVKEFLLGSVSSTVLRMSRGSAVWVIEI
jgi:nucleotide-binding universal stress UspA family protein